MASVPLKELGFDEFVLALTVQCGLSGERSYSFPPMMISSNLRGWPAIVVCIVKRDACWGLAGAPALLLQPATTSSEIGSTSHVCAFTALILASAYRSLDDLGVLDGDAARGKSRRSNDLLDDEDNIDQFS